MVSFGTLQEQHCKAMQWSEVEYNINRNRNNADDEDPDEHLGELNLKGKTKTALQGTSWLTGKIAIPSV